MRPRNAIIVAVLVCAAAVYGQKQVSQQSSTVEVDINGRPVQYPSFSSVQTPTGAQRSETTRSINGREVPLQSSEDRVLSQDATSKVIERTVRYNTATGNPGLAERVRIEERKNPDGSTTMVSTTYRNDINGNPQLWERTTTEVRKGATITESTSTLERANLNGGLQVFERTRAVERTVGDATQADATTYRRDVNGNLSPFKQEARTTEKRGNEQSVDSAQYELGPDGKMQLAIRAVGKTVKNPDGSEVEQVDVYSRHGGQSAADVNASQPRLQQQILRQKSQTPEGKIVETTSVRARLAQDPSRFGNFEQVTRTTTVATDATGREVRSTETQIGRRDASGNIVVQEKGREQTVVVK